MNDKIERLPGEGLKAYHRRIKKQHIQNKKEDKRQAALYRHAQLVYDDIDRSPDSDPSDIERPSF
jgi:hypothetical protein